MKGKIQNLIHTKGKQDSVAHLGVPHLGVPHCHNPIVVNGLAAV